MSANAAECFEPWVPSPESDREWPELSTQAPHLAVTMRRYLLQLTTFLAPRSVDAADVTLRQFARWIVANTDVIDALLSLSRSRYDRVQALKDFHINRYGLMRLAGTIEEIL